MLCSTCLLVVLYFLSNVLGSYLPHSISERAIPSRNCSNVSDGLHPTCWDVLKMDAYLLEWNVTTRTCHKDELWPNCFMREAGVLTTENESASEDLGCAQVGPNTCPAPSQEQLAAMSPQVAYGAYSISALQQYFDSIYTSLSTPNGTAKVQSLYGNSSNLPAKILFARLFADQHKPLASQIGRVVISDIPVPFAETTIPTLAQTPQALERVLAGYLESFMTNFTLGGFEGCARHGALLRGEVWIE